MFAVLQSDINSLKSLLHLIGQPYCKKSRSAKVKDGIINITLRNYHVDQYSLYYKNMTIIKDNHHEGCLYYKCSLGAKLTAN